jgi:hypothetical protein
MDRAGVCSIPVDMVGDWLAMDCPEFLIHPLGTSMIRLGSLLNFDGMQWDEFKSSVTGRHPPRNISPCLEALWYDGNGNWERAHQIAQEIEDKNGAWIHAYLHRKEGDLGNARYWYSMAGKKMPEQSLREEWEALTREFLVTDNPVRHSGSDPG